MIPIRKDGLWRASSLSAFNSLSDSFWDLYKALTSLGQRDLNPNVPQKDWSLYRLSEKLSVLSYLSQGEEK